MALGDTFDLGRILQTAEAIKGMRREEENDKLRNAYLGVTMDNAKQQGEIARAEEARKQSAFTQDQMWENTRLINVAAKSVAADPSTAAQWLPQLKKAGVVPPDLELGTTSPEQLKAVAQRLAQQTDVALQARIRQDPQFAQIDQEHQNRLTLLTQQGAQAEKQSAVNFGRQKELAGVEHGFRMEAIEAQGANALAVAAAKASKDKQVDQAAIQRTWTTYEKAKQGLLSGLKGTDTGPIAGRMPAVTTGQQVAEGSISAMAPVLKQIFRVAGEGTFTDRDQALLLEMVPTRKDSPEARALKMQNIDNIIRAKLGIPDAQNADPLGIR